MNATLIPSPAQLEVLLLTAIVAVLCIGIGLWTGARRAETALVAGWGVAALASIIVGTLTGVGLAWVMLALALAGSAGLARLALAPHRLQAAMLGRVVVLALPLIAGSAGVAPVAWDDFTHWLPNLTYLSLYNHFPSLAVPDVSHHAGYPYGLALPGFAI